MADKMMRIAGRDPAGLAQNISLDKNGGLIVSGVNNMETVMNAVSISAKSGDVNGTATSSAIYFGADQVDIYATCGSGVKLTQFPFTVNYLNYDGGAVNGTQTEPLLNTTKIGGHHFKFTFFPKSPYGTITIENTTAILRIWTVKIVRTSLRVVKGIDGNKEDKPLRVTENGSLIITETENIETVATNLSIPAKEGETNGSATTGVIWLGLESVKMHVASDANYAFSNGLLRLSINYYYDPSGSNLVTTQSNISYDLAFNSGSEAVYTIHPITPWAKIYIENTTTNIRNVKLIEIIRHRSNRVEVTELPSVDVRGETPLGLPSVIKTDYNGFLETKVSDSYRQRLERVVNLVGLDNFAMFMTFQESSEPYYDLFNKTLGVKADIGNRFYTVNGGPFGHYTSWRDKPVGSPVRLISSNSFEGGSTDPVFAKKYAVYLPQQEDFLGSCCIRIKGVGSGRKQFKVTLYSDNAGTPGTLLAQHNKVFLNGSRNDPVYDTNTSVETQITSAYYWVPMSLITGFGLSGYKAKWLVLEYADETGIDATNHVLWRYGANAGGKMAYHNGSDWVVTDDYSFEYMLYPEDIQLPEDFTICTLFKNSKANSGEQRIITLLGHSYGTFIVQNGYNVLNVSWVDEGGLSNAHNYRPHFPLTEQWSVIAVTFNRYRTSRNGKVQAYLNGRMLDGYQEDINPSGTQVREGVSGRGGAKLLRYGSLALCHTIAPNGFNAGSSNTDIGPFFIAKRALAPDEIASVSSLMLGDYSKLEE